MREDDHQWETQKSRLRSSNNKGMTTVPGNRTVARGAPRNRMVMRDSPKGGNMP